MKATEVTAPGYYWRRANDSHPWEIVRADENPFGIEFKWIGIDAEFSPYEMDECGEVYGPISIPVIWNGALAR